MDHEQDNENGFERRSWSPPAIKDTSSTLHLGGDPDGRGRDRDMRPGGGKGPGGFRFNPECTCWRCAVERLCMELETLERTAPEVTEGRPHWDARLGEEIEAVRELEAEIDALQGMDAAARARALFLDGDV